MIVKQKKSFKNMVVWIIGASSGIGAALAKELSSRGAILALSARNTDKLILLKTSLEGTKHEIFPLDVCDKEAVIRSAEIIKMKFGCIDSIIFFAAAYTPMKVETIDMEITRQIVEINLLSAFHISQLAISLFKKQSYGQIVLCGSVAGYYGLPGGQPYSATKAGIINLAETLRSELPKNIDVKLINPGFVKTALTNKNDFYMPMMIEPHEAAVFIANRLLKKGFEIHFPRCFTYLLKLLQLLPYNLSLKMSSKLNK